MRINLRKLDTIVNTAVELSIAHHSETYLLSNFNDMIEKQEALINEWHNLRECLDVKNGSLPSNVREHIERYSNQLSSFHNDLGDLNRAVELNFSLWENLANSLGTEVLQLQLQPLSTLFDMFDRIVRDLSTALGKSIALEVHGGDVEVDRRIIEALKDPFTHLLRNAIDHGIEIESIRRAQNKKSTGTITINAQQMGFSFAITIADDGGGLDRQRILAEAVKRNLGTNEQLVLLSDQDVFRLLLRPGFSTRETVSDISGRGVGLDVVATNVQQFGGEIHISSELGKGTTFQIILPTTLTLSRVLLIEIGSALFSFPVTGTEQIIFLQETNVKELYGKMVTQYNDAFIPVIEIEDALNLPRSSKRTRNGLILRKNDALICVSVPHVADEMELMTKPLPRHLKMNPFISGANVLPDGRTSLALNVHALLERQPQKAHEESDTEKKGRKLLLVVDDSLIARELLRNILLASGYEVMMARDGREALQIIRIHTIDLVLTDIEMPGMDGFTLTKQIKEDDILRLLPVIMVTSKEEPEQRTRGMACGADAYLLKGSFNQNNLLATISRLLEEKS